MQEDELGYFQLPMTGAGFLMVLVSGLSAPQLQGATGLQASVARISMFMVGGLGYTLMAAGLAIPNSGESGIQFSHVQRELLVLACVTALFSSVFPVAVLALPSLGGLTLGRTGLVWAALIAVSWISFVGALALKTSELFHERFNLAGENG